MKIGERLRQRREELGLTLEAVAEQLHVHRSTVMRYENGKTQRIPLSTIEKLAVILKTNTQHLMGWDEPGFADAPPAGAQDFQVLMRLFSSMPEEQKGLLIKIAKTMCDIADETQKN